MKGYLNYHELREQLEGALKELVDSGRWGEFLHFASRFSTYSPRNTLLIYGQCQKLGITPSYLAGYSRWKELGRWVKKGSVGVRIVVPLTQRAHVAESNYDGSLEPLDELKVVGFRAASIFDLSQTEGEPFEEPMAPKLLSGQGDQVAEEFLGNLLVRQGFTVVSGTLDEGVNGYTDFSGRVVALSDSLSDMQRLKTLAHEFAHASMHERGATEREVAELEAETFAFLYMSGIGYDSVQYSAPYLLRWAGGSVETALRGFERAHSLFLEVAAKSSENDEVESAACHG
jgi:hypothetical protein